MLFFRSSRFFVVFCDFSRLAVLLDFLLLVDIFYPYVFVDFSRFGLLNFLFFSVLFRLPLASLGPFDTFRLFGYFLVVHAKPLPNVAFEFLLFAFLCAVWHSPHVPSASTVS